MSRNKGNGAEREVAKLLKAWWEVFEPGVNFVRVPLSGGWGGPAIRSGFAASGDVMTTAKEFPFTVEVKRREAWTMKNLRAGKRSPVWGWWRQAETQAKEMNAYPMLWVRQNRDEWRVVLPRHSIPEVFAAGFAEEKFEWPEGALDSFGFAFTPSMVLAADLLRLPAVLFSRVKMRGRAIALGAHEHVSEKKGTGERIGGRNRRGKTGGAGV